MELVVALLAGAAGLEVLVVSLPGGRLRKLIAAVSLLAVMFASGGLVAAGRNVAALLICVLGLYRAINLLRLVEARMNEQYLRRAVRTTSAWLIGAQLCIGLAWLMAGRLHLAQKHWAIGLSGLQVAVAVMLLAATLRNLRTTRFRPGNEPLADKDLPSLTVAVPARNESEQLDDCLRAILATDYPKLEVIVLDDRSQDRTPEIIRQFAHDGVRFVPGDEPRPNWLAKNQAYDRLARESSGDIILFCGVDIRFAAPTIRQLVGTMLAKRKAMLSLMPLNEQSGAWPQAMRYMWELALPRRRFNRPPVLSSCWLIRRDELERAGGFAAVAHAITPEAYFAKQCLPHDSYSFMRSGAHLGLTSTKTLAEQRDTAVRTRYPQVHRRPELAALVSLAELVLLAGPFGVAIAGILNEISVITLMFGLAAIVLLYAAYARLCAAVFLRGRWLIMPFLPLAVLGDVALLNYSLWKYEFSTVIWKGRNASEPVMRAIPHLPDLQ